MASSRIVFKQREKEARSLKSFLMYSVMASFVIHIGLIGLVFGELLRKFKQENPQVVELEIIEEPEPIKETVTKPPEMKISATESKSGSLSSGKITGNKNFKVLMPRATFPRMDNPIPEPKNLNTGDSVVKYPLSSTIPRVTTRRVGSKIAPTTKVRDQIRPNPQLPIPKVIQTETTQPVVTSITNTKLPIAQPTTFTDGNTDNTPIGGTDANNIPQTPLVNGIGNGNGVGNGDGIGNGDGDGVENTRKTEETPTPKASPNTGAILSRVDCIQCPPPKYPEGAKRRGRSGTKTTVHLILDADSNGNITSVSVDRPSGDNELDEAAREGVEEWKLKPLEGGRRGVRAKVNFKL
ncbi:TonB family protein [Cylindrospermopsis raciborskii CHAB3438]|uniref:energy transducer TonB n=1 Tax=Cylindrospermopsis raciborskii TaxID=77022 RepID=UPI001F114E83|nr:energy transducer TonB [Cylindrospermopsis raciborskii]MCH4903358.1 TonB family protein [Cylindrospermopsis raciborskii CHAB3438]